MKQRLKFLLLTATFVASGAVGLVTAQGVQQQPIATEQQQQTNPGSDPIRQLNLSPEQREQIRAIREANKTERAAIAQRVREANEALNEALDSDSPDEAVVEQRMRDVAAAQAAAMRMRIMTEVKIRKVLTKEQLVTLRNLRVQARQAERLQRREDRREQRQIMNGAPALQNDRGNVDRLLRRRQIQRQQRP